MKTPSLIELKKELNHLDSSQLKECLLRLVRYKKENKELLSYLLFDADNEKEFVDKVKESLDQQFQEVNKNNYYLIKKNLRKILRYTNKYIKYSGSKETEIELRIYFCQSVKRSGIRLSGNATLVNLYQGQVKKITSVMKKLHEDLQYDYQQVVNEL